MGHLVRGLEIARALATDFEVVFITGGEITPQIPIPPGVQLVCLPALQTDSGLANLQSSSIEDLDAIKRDRTHKLLTVFDRTSTDVLVTEMFPFGRKQFEFELIPLLQAAKEKGTFTVSSVRDVLVRKSDHAAYEQRVVESVNAYYDLVLIHGDPRLIPFDESFSRMDHLMCDVGYTGYVTQTSAAAASLDDSRQKDHTIVVSIGAGRCEGGHDLLKAVFEAARLLCGNISHRFDVFTGPFMPEQVFDDMLALARHLPNITIARYTNDLAGHMRRADLSISMGGYNTVMDILQAGVPSLVYPVVGNRDEEQAVRARKLESAGILQVVRSLAPQQVAQQIQHGLNLKPSPLRVDLQGAERSTRLILASMASRCVSADPVYQTAFG
jgi:predicted glycosyltransferase